VPNKFLPLEELKTSREWIRLNASQRRLVSAYIASGYDKAQAVQTIYECGTEGSQRTTINRVFGNADVKAFLALHFGDTPQDQFKEELRRAISNPKLSQTRIQALKMLAKSLGLDEAAVPSAPAGKVVAEKEFEKDGKRFRTTVTELP
jgi:hypothetical protein